MALIRRIHNILKKKHGVIGLEFFGRIKPLGIYHIIVLTSLILLSVIFFSISNFVNIVTNRSDIPVTFQQAGDSYTDGKSVVIGSKIDEKNFDSTVGLALHEGSHIKLSNFALLRNLDSSIPEELYRLGERKGRDRNQVFADVRNILNYIEDRRIDYYVF